jgi:hypothetical protein
MIFIILHFYNKFQKMKCSSQEINLWPADEYVFFAKPVTPFIILVSVSKCYVYTQLRSEPTSKIVRHFHICTNIIRNFLSVEAYLRFKFILYFREKICRYIINAVIDISYVYLYICISCSPFYSYEFYELK